jgi:replicative DNA helicase
MTTYDEPPPPTDEPPYEPGSYSTPTPIAAATAAERALLGTLITDPATAHEHLENTDPGDFYQPRHELIWNAIKDVVAKGLIPDHPTLVAHLAANGDLKRVGDHNYLLDLREAAPLIPQHDHWAQIIRDAAGLRRLDNDLIHLREKIATTSHDQTRTKLEEISELADRIAGNFGPSKSDKHGRLIHGDTFILDRPDTIPATWGQGNEILWAEGEPLLIAGPAGVGKTTIAQQVMLAGIGLRADALGYKVQPFTRVLYIAADRPPQAARSLERMVTEEDRDTLRDRLIFWKGPPDRDFAKHPDELTRMCKLVNADAVIIDSLKDVALGLSDDEVGASLNSCIQRTLVNGVQVLALHHYRKRSQDHAKAEPKSLDELYGSTWITAGAGSVLSLWGAAGDPVVTLRQLKQPAEEIPPSEVTHNHDSGVSSILAKVDLLQQLRMRGRKGITPSVAACLMTHKDKPSPAEREKARRQLERFLSDGLAIKDPTLSGVGRGAEAVYLPAARKDQIA